MIKYLELDKETLDIKSGPWSSDVLPVFADDSPNIAKEVISMPDAFIVPGQIWNDATSSIEDTQDSINWKARSYLNSTDWYEIRAISGTTTPQNILDKRQEARDSIV